MKILVVDDSDIVRRVMASLLSREGFEVIEAADGAEAARAAETSGKLGAVVTDVCMPNLNGFSLATELRRRDPKLPFVFVSGFPIDYSQIGEHARMLVKPFQHDELVAAVTAVSSLRA